ncbi:Glyco hydro 18 domain containing protein [Trichuris trichiura]|uniref:Glyco hydro 18 domain containing protein n=1 Tax=Trichuris trichiura TaxID=36087 RepID=A0A077ZLY3_TRITR|nr:Glyco hydro 18 domain containing protein [Trichuris trichiura]
MLSIGGWTFGTRKFKTMAFNSENRQTFIKSVIEYLRRHEFDENKKSMVKLLQVVKSDCQLREPLDYPFHLTYFRLLDFINLMSYDFYGSWDWQTGIDGPLFSHPSCAAAALAGHLP